MIACQPIVNSINRAHFTIWRKDDIKQISVKKITEPRTFEKANTMSPDGLYSPALGPTKRYDLCSTCGLSGYNCPGHYGHIELSVPVYHPMLVRVLYQIISKCCLECFRFRLPQASLKLFLSQLEALNNGFDHLIDELDEIFLEMTRDSKTEDESYIQVAVGKKLNKRIQEEKDKIPDFDCQKRPQQRSIVERLNRIFRAFITGHIVKPTKICPHCAEKKVSISLHQSSVIVVGVGSSKPIGDIDDLAKAIDKPRKKKKMKKSCHVDSVNDLNYLSTDDKRFLTPIGAKNLLKKIWDNEKRVMKRIFHFLNMEAEDIKSEGENNDMDPKESLKTMSKFHPVDQFFVDTIMVPPSKFRPPMSQNGYSYEGPHTGALSSIMKQSIIVQGVIDQIVSEIDEVEAEKLQVKLQSEWRKLQNSVNTIYDSDMDKYGKDKYPGLKQLIDKKEGLFRKNMMGKRVNFAARSVISPDPNISVDQIGVPLVFAMKLTYPEPVTPMNIGQLKEAVLNGPNKYPGAHSVVFDDGMTVLLNRETTRQNLSHRLSYKPRLSRNNQNENPMVTVVNRHLLSGDVLLFNRQPTLHKPSIMAFRARVLPNEKGFRLHYANCKSFNADFDGDEMNAHLPQSYLARSEAYNIASVNYQYLVPKDGSPLGGLIQDHVVAVCILTDREQFLDRERYDQLVYGALASLGKTIVLEPPTIIKPTPLWTGKQVITTVIKNCIPPNKPPPSLEIKSKISPKILGIGRGKEDLSDCDVIIKNGELLKGFMDKTNVGATQYGLIHTCYELYGGETSSNLMSAFARLSTIYLQLYEGFTLGIGDIIVDDAANLDRKRMIEESLHLGDDSAKEALGIEGHVSSEELEGRLREAHSDRDPLPMKLLDSSMKSRTDSVTSDISSRCLPDGLIRRFPENNLQMMIQSGAKGGTVNALQISCLLGQIELEGRRVPLSMSGRSLPSFKPYDTSPKAGGFVTGRFLTGIQPQEFFFHCMAGREGLIDTAVKTSRSGYLQRCLIKHLEGITVHYDQTVRDSCGSVIQFLYGEDGLDIVKSQMLKEKAFPSLVENYNVIKPAKEELDILNKARENYEEEVIARTDLIQQWVERNGDSKLKSVRGSGFLDFLAAKFDTIKESLEHSKNSSEELEDIIEAMESSTKTLKKKEKIKYEEEEEKKNENENDDDDDNNDDSHLGMPKNTSQSQQSQSSQSDPRLREQLLGAWYALSFKEKRKWNKFWEACPDPLTSIMNPGSHFGVVPERLDELIEQFIKENPKLIIDPAQLIGCAGDDMDASMMEANLAYNENQELSETILTHLNRSNIIRHGPKLTRHEFYNLCYILYMKMLAQPGEAVGLLAAQSIGEPSTQMTLNTFHFAGRGEMNVTLGIPRLREILMTASSKIGTPSMDLPIMKVMKDESGNELTKEDVEDQITKVKLALNAVRLSDILEYVDITEQVISVSETPSTQKGIQGRGVNNDIDKDIGKGKSRNRSSSSFAVKRLESRRVCYVIKFVILPSKYYKHEFQCNSAKAMKFIEEVFVSQLVDAISKRNKKLVLGEDLYDIGVKKMTRRASEVTTNRETGSDPSGLADDDPEENDLNDFNAKANAQEKSREGDSSSEEEEEDEADNTTERLKSRRQDLEYQEPEEDDLNVGEIDANVVELEENQNEILAEDENSNEDIHNLIDQDIIIQSNSGHHFEKITDRTCKLTIWLDLRTSRIDMGALIELEAKRSYINRVGNIQRALIVTDPNASSRGAKSDKMIKTEGVSLLSLVKFNHILDLNSIYTNDIHAIANTYGIEAASQAIRREMANVFAVYGIEVDSRHLSLIADYMTYSGTIRGMNRMSMEASASPFQQMSFESCMKYLKDAAILGLYDDVKSPSASLVFGRPTRGGTGTFSLLQEK